MFTGAAGGNTRGARKEVSSEQTRHNFDRALWICGQSMTLKVRTRRTIYPFRKVSPVSTPFSETMPCRKVKCVYGHRHILTLSHRALPQ